jgi:hypothetical protein
MDFTAADFAKTMKISIGRVALASPPFEHTTIAAQSAFLFKAVCIVSRDVDLAEEVERAFLVEIERIQSLAQDGGLH